MNRFLVGILFAACVILGTEAQGQGQAKTCMQAQHEEFLVRDVSCLKNGDWAAVQCDDLKKNPYAKCWCVDDDGNPITSAETGEEYKVHACRKVSMGCRCARHQQRQIKDKVPLSDIKSICNFLGNFDITSPRVTIKV